MKSLETIPGSIGCWPCCAARCRPTWPTREPWARADRRPIRIALDRLVADQRLYAGRVAEAIVERGGRPDPGRFPLEFAAKNDLSLEFLLHEILQHQEQDMLAIERCAAQLEGESSLHALAEEVLGNAQGHLDVLREMMNDE